MIILKKIYNKFFANQVLHDYIESPLEIYLRGKKEPWTEGYNDYKWKIIEESINDSELINKIKANKLPNGFGKGIDERSVEYPWLFSKINNVTGKFLDAGSTFNFDVLLKHPILKNKEKYIYTYYPESNNFLSERISYVFGDLRDLPFKDNFFDTVVCHSTLEHIDMDNSMYGYELGEEKNRTTKSYEYLKVIWELQRIANKGAKILLTFPYGVFENHGFFQQFDNEMVQKMVDMFIIECEIKLNYFLYEMNGWRFATEKECTNAQSFNPHTGKGKGEDGAAHSRAICLIEAIKK